MNQTQDVAAARWGIAYHSNSHSPRARKWYRVTRLIQADGAIFELYWHPDLKLRGGSRMMVWAAAKAAGLDVAPGTYRDALAPRVGSVMERAS
jgi:hypothetical protein